MRYCIAPNCKNDDTKILGHRFPKNLQRLEKWRTALDLERYSYEDLQKKYIVCTMHFDKTDYKNILSNELNFVAVPKLSGHQSRVDLLKNTDNIPNDQSVAILDNKDDDNFDEDNINKTLLYDEDGFLIHFEGEEKTTSEYVKNHGLIVEEIPFNGYESDVEVIDINEAIESEAESAVDSRIESCEILGTKPLSDGFSDTVSLISTTGTSPILELEQLDKFCQTDMEQYIDPNEPEEYQKLNRNDLITKIGEQKGKIEDLDKKLNEFQKAHSKLVQSLDAFKSILNGDGN